MTLYIIINNFLSKHKWDQFLINYIYFNLLVIKLLKQKMYEIYQNRF